ncbi:MAG: DUF5011 domain-containing protein, partial [Firmicutes bacterium]|nr:DUF5011 domain-containing protein [Bacillota bacterium]
MKKILFTFGFLLMFLLSGCSTSTLNDLDAQMSDLKEELISLQQQLVGLENDASQSSEELLLMHETQVSLQLEIDALLDEIALLESKLDNVGDNSLVIAPVFSNVPANQIIEYGTDFDLLDVGITVLDNIDGDLTDSITVNIEDTSILKMGNHAVTYTVTDSDGNSTFETINLEIIVSEHVLSFILMNDGTEVKITGFS